MAGTLDIQLSTLPQSNCSVGFPVLHSQSWRMEMHTAVSDASRGASVHPASLGRSLVSMCWSHLMIVGSPPSTRSWTQLRIDLSPNKTNSWKGKHAATVYKNRPRRPSDAREQRSHPD